MVSFKGHFRFVVSFGLIFHCWGSGTILEKAWLLRRLFSVLLVHDWSPVWLIVLEGLILNKLIDVDEIVPVHK